MGELDEAIAASNKPPERDYLDEWRDESLRRTQEFVEKMHNVGKTALYAYNSFREGQSSPSWSKKVRYHVGHEFVYVDEGWIMTRGSSDGPDQHYIILPDTRVYKCNLPGLYKEEQAAKNLDRRPYVTTTARLDMPETTLFAHAHGLALLVSAVKHNGQPKV